MEEDEFEFFDKDIEEELRKMQRIAKAIFEKIAKEDFNAKKPFVYGFSMRVEDSKPIEFKNVQPIIKIKSRGLPKTINKKEQLIDVIEGEKTISITAEIPNVEKKDIDIEATENSLTISINTPSVKYHKEIPLPCKIKQDTANVSYKNGVLDIEFEKAEGKKRKKINIQ